MGLTGVILCTLLYLVMAWCAVTIGGHKNIGAIESWIQRHPRILMGIGFALIGYIAADHLVETWRLWR